jgi:hypothetical protein
VRERSWGWLRAVRIVRIRVLHEGTFWSLVRAACESERCLRHEGRYWVQVAGGNGLAAYRPANCSLGWFQERVEEYEVFLYRQLLEGHVGRDGRLRPHSRLRQGPGGAYRPTPRAARQVG